jgi:hypothetical protein
MLAGNPPLVFRSRTSRLVLLGMGCGIFVAVSLFLLSRGLVLPALAGLVFFGGGGAWGLGTLLRSRNILTLEPAGVRPMKGGLIPWRDVEGFGAGTTPGGPSGVAVLGMRMTDYDAYIASLTPTRTRLALPHDSMSSILAYTRELTGWDLTWSALVLDRSLDDAVAAAEAYRIDAS